MNAWVPLTQRVALLEPSVETDRPGLGYIRGSKASASIDGGNSVKHARLFLEHIRKEKYPVPTFTFLTHWHWDHIFGLGALDNWIVASEETKKYLAPMKDQDLEKEIMESDYQLKNEFVDAFDVALRMPSITYKERCVFDLGGLTVLTQLVESDHTTDCSVVFIPEEKILFIGDCLYCGSERGQYYLDRLRYLTLMKTLLHFPAELYLDSHRQPITRARLTATLEKVTRIAEASIEYPDVAEALRFLQMQNGFEADDEISFFLKAFENGEQRKPRY